MIKEEQSARITVDSADPQAEHGKDTQCVKQGEKGFTYVLAVIFTFMFYQSVLLWQEKPGIDGPAIIPLISSGAILVMTLCQLTANRKKRADDTPAIGMERVRRVVRYVIPLNVAVAFGAILIYCLLLALGVSFYLVTPVFLWGLMTFFRKGKYLSNLLWTALCMLWILAVFQMLFNVILP